MAAFIAPALLVYVVFVLLPVALAAVYSFFNWNGLSALDRFIGFDNYVRALTDPVFQGAIFHNFAIVGLSLAIQGPVAIAVALLLNRPLRGRGLGEQAAAAHHERLAVAGQVHADELEARCGQAGAAALVGVAQVLRVDGGPINGNRPRPLGVLRGASPARSAARGPGLNP